MEQAARDVAAPTDLPEVEVLQIFERTGALLQGHFELRSGLHSDRYFQCAMVLQWPVWTARLCSALAHRLLQTGVQPPFSVIAPAMGGLFVGHELARAFGVRSIFAEKEREQGRLVLRRGFRVEAGERFVVAEDVVTRGGRVSETMALIRERGGAILAVAALVDRSAGAVDFGVPFVSLLKMSPATWDPSICPLCREGLPLEHPGS